ncbi:hypothetical protein [Streptomyces sp. NPDC002889]|uniref:hypothetical protein n=1 Tax=Streptomyces sp. NPDC002889 TaxID=3364669 RepID=UPI0036877581
MTTALLTEQAVTEAEEAARLAEEERLAAQRAYARHSASPSNYSELNRAADAAQQAADRARALRAVFDEQQAEREQRAALLRDTTQKLAPVSKRLANSRDAAVQALAEAQQAMARALAVVVDHDQLVRDTAAGLKGGGWRLADGESTGCDIGGALHLAGERWCPVDGPSLLASVLGAQVAAMGSRHPLGRQVWPSYGGVSPDGRADLLARLKAVTC